MDNYVRFENKLTTFLNESEFITTDRYLDFSKRYEFIVYRKRDFLFHGGTWRGQQQNNLFKNFNAYRGKIVVTGHADKTTSLHASSVIKALGAMSIFGINTLPKANFSFSQPIGVCDDCDDSPIHRILGNKKHFSRADSSASHLTNYNNSIYINFTTSNNHDARSYAIRSLKEFTSKYRINFQQPEFSDKGRINYLMGLRENSFVLCPEGNGVDTHRLWETLYMGGIPIVLSNPILDPLIADLPVLVLSDWQELGDHSYVESKWEEMRVKTWNYSKLRFSFWENRILNHYRNLSQFLDVH